MYCNKKWRYQIGFAINGSVMYVIEWENHTVYKYTVSGEFIQGISRRRSFCPPWHLYAVKNIVCVTQQIRCATIVSICTLYLECGAHE